MLKVKRILIMVLLVCGLCLMNTSVQAAGELSPILKADGTNLIYRGTNNNVMGLTNYEYKVQDFRSTWVATVSNLDIDKQTSIESYKANLKTIINDLKSWGMNAIIFQIRPMNDAFYESELNHWSEFLNNGEDPGWDMLGWLIEESHKAGLEFHAWLNPYRIAGGNVESIEEYAQSVAAKNALHGKNNLASNPDMLLKTSAGGLIFNPGEPAVRQFLIDTVAEIVENYDVDAIHFDDYFYAQLANDSADNITMQKYPIAGINNKADWRREQVTTFIRDLSNYLKDFNARNNRVIQLGISPTGIWANKSSNPNGSNTAGFEHYGHYLYADTRKWVKENYLDYILPQTYWGLEHTTAPFADLAKWWAEQVRGTNVNLYLGNGLYMERPGYDRADWLNKPNEIDNQLKVMGVYPEIQGYCFFRYETVKTATPQYISGYNGIQLIKNDYWKTLIPGAPLRRYLDVVTDAPVNLRQYDTTITWNEVDNARGYVVYKVEKGVNLDQNNPKHIYTYLASNSVTIEDSENYDIYVASVSKANHISSATKYEFSLDSVENIIQAIDNLPTPVSLDDQPIVTAIRNAYDNLNSSDKALITNYQKLVAAEASINTLLTFEAEAERILGITPRQIKTNYLLPTSNTLGAEVSWRYRNGEDQSLYNIATGELLVRKITVANRILELVIEKDGLTFTKEVTINFSNLDADKVGLYYYNTPASISKDEEGSATYLGFSGKVLEINNYVLFIPDGNYLELTDTSILNTNWLSCAVVLYNASETTLTFKQGDTRIESSVPGYGYIIIGTNGLIKTISTSYDPNNMISLAAGEYLFAPKYLDSLINGSPFKPVTKLTVGTPAKVYDFFVEENSVTDVIEAIDLIPENISLADEPLIINARILYNGLSSEEQALVTNYNKLQAAEEQLEELKAAEALAIKKQAALATLNAIDLSKYSIISQELIVGLINEATTQINGASSIAEVEAILEAALDEIEQVLTLEEEAELQDYRERALDDLKNYFNEEDYREEKFEEIQAIILDVEAALNQATTKSAIDQIVDNAKAEIDLIPTKAEQEAEELTELIEEKIQELTTYVNLDLYSEENQATIEQIIESYTEQLRDASSSEEVNTLLSQAKSEIDAIPKKTSGTGCKFGTNVTSIFAIFASLSLIAYLYFKRR